MHLPSRWSRYPEMASTLPVDKFPVPASTKIGSPPTVSESARSPGVLPFIEASVYCARIDDFSIMQYPQHRMAGSSIGSLGTLGGTAIAYCLPCLRIVGARASTSVQMALSQNRTRHRQGRPTIASRLARYLTEV